MAGCRQQQQQIPTVLNVAEKPSVARALAAVFSRIPGSQDRPMHREAAQIFRHENVCFPSIFAQGQGQIIQGPGKLAIMLVVCGYDAYLYSVFQSLLSSFLLLFIMAVSPHIMVTTSVRGHLASQDFGPNYGWKNCNPIELFDAPIDTLYRSDMEPLERMLRQLAQRCNAVILWLDCDREGEAIGDEVRAVCWRSNPNLPMYRARFSTVLPNEIQRALTSLGRLNESFVQAVQARSELDLRVGAAFTRFQTLRLQKKFDGFDQGLVVSYGPCQFPTLGFVVERWARIETFVPEDFWYLELTLRIPIQPAVAAQDAHRGDIVQSNNPGRPITFIWNRGRLYDQVATTVLYAMSLDAGEAVVTELTGRPRNKWRPVPLATVELQKRASKYMRIGSETLMTAAEELYQSGYISYPRTETEKYRPEFEHQPLLQDFSQVGGEVGA
jgi:DNA topoisomerase-3